VHVPPADLHIPILGQLPPTELSLGDALEPGALELARLATPPGSRPLGQKPLEDAPRDPDPHRVTICGDKPFHRARASEIAPAARF
jgi:hypothetical protein